MLKLSLGFLVQRLNRLPPNRMILLESSHVFTVLNGELDLLRISNPLEAFFFVRKVSKSLLNWTCEPVFNGRRVLQLVNVRRLV